MAAKDSPSNSDRGSSLDPSAEEIRRWGNAAIKAMADYHGSIRERRLYPQTTAHQIRERLERALPAEGSDFETVLATFRDAVVDLRRHDAHPRTVGYVRA